jgi:hypothetical protein
LHLDAETGVLHGTPPFGSRGAAAVTLVVYDALNRRCSEPFVGTAEIRPQKGLSIDPLQILSERLPGATVNAPYRVPISLRGGAPPFQFNGRQMPNGLSLSQNGIIEGVPSTEGAFSFQVEVVDSLNPPQRADAMVSIEIEPQQKPLTIETEAKLPDGKVGKDYDIALAASGGNGIYEWQAEGGLPKGLSIRQGRLVGTPSAATGLDATFLIIVRCGGAHPMRVQKTLSLTVLSRKDIPSIRSPRWLWLGAIFVTSALLKALWRRYCLMHITFG